MHADQIEGVVGVEKGGTGHAGVGPAGTVPKSDGHELEYVPAGAISGTGNIASGVDAFAVGTGNTASGNASFASGAGTTAAGADGHTEGSGTAVWAGATGAHAEGVGTSAQAAGAHAEGQGTTASGIASHAEGTGTTASGAGAHAGGASSTASGDASFAQGQGCTATAAGAIAVGTGCHATAAQAVAMGNNCTASAIGAVAVGVGCTASGQGAFACGDSSSATAADAVAMGAGASASQSGAHAESGSTASGIYSHAEGGGTASGSYSHADGQGASATGVNSRACGAYAKAAVEASESFAGGRFAATGDAQMHRKIVRGTTPGVGAAEAVSLLGGINRDVPITLEPSKSYLVTARAVAAKTGLGAGTRESWITNVQALVDVKQDGTVVVTGQYDVHAAVAHGAGFVASTLVLTAGGANTLVCTFTVGAGLTTASRCVAQLELVEVLGT